jgi:hypothetical protein
VQDRAPRTEATRHWLSSKIILMMMLHMRKYRGKTSYSYDETVGSASSSHCRIRDLGGHKIIIFSLFYFFDPLQRTGIVLVSTNIYSHVSAQLS